MMYNDKQRRKELDSMSKAQLVAHVIEAERGARQARWIAGRLQEKIDSLKAGK